jgi:hypothetical protein
MIITKHDHHLNYCIVNEEVPKHSSDYECCLEVLSHSTCTVVPAPIVNDGVYCQLGKVCKYRLNNGYRSLDMDLRVAWRLTWRSRTMNGQTEPIQIVYFRTCGAKGERRSFLEHQKEHGYCLSTV